MGPALSPGVPPTSALGRVHPLDRPPEPTARPSECDGTEARCGRTGPVGATTESGRFVSFVERAHARSKSRANSVTKGRLCAQSVSFVTALTKNRTKHLPRELLRATL